MSVFNPSIQLLRLIAGLWLFGSISNADVIVVDVTEDARVLSFFPDSNEGNGVFLSVYNNPGNSQNSYLFFDLSAHSGSTVIGDGTLTLASTGDANNFVLNGFLYQAAGSWDEASISWNNQPSSTGASLSTINGTFTQLVNWTLPNAILQGWLDNPGSNLGLVLIADTTSTLTFHSSENGISATIPRLTFNTVPEPSMPMMLALLFLSRLFGRHRTANTGTLHRLCNA